MITTQNIDSAQPVKGGAFTQTNTGVIATVKGIANFNTIPGLINPLPPIQSIDIPQQVMGLVPVFPCCGQINNCVSFLFTLTEAISGDIIGTIKFTDGYGAIINIDFIFTSGESQSDCITQIINSVNSTDVYTASSDGNQITICCPDTVQYNNGAVEMQIYSNIINISGGITFVEGGAFSFFYGIQWNGIFLTIPNDNCDCREGNYLPDNPYADDTQIPLPVYADLSDSNPAFNDFNYWLFLYPLTASTPVNDFNLQMYENGVWVNIAVLNNNTYGVYYNYSMTDVNYQGFEISWNLILSAFGAGTYRFNQSGGSYCFNSPPFCLQPYSCYACDRTVKFLTQVTGGNSGSVTQQGNVWALSGILTSGSTSSGASTGSDFKAGVGTGDTGVNSSLSSPVTISATPQDFRNITNNDGDYDGVNTFTANIVASQVFSGVIVWTGDCGNRSNFTESRLTVELVINGSVVQTLVNLAFLPGVTSSYTFSFAPVNMNIGDTAKLNVLGETVFNTQSLQEGYIYVCQAGSYWMNTYNTTVTTTTGATNTFAITWNDSIRFEGFFGRQAADFKIDEIKYLPGTITKVRDEMLKKLELWVAPMPQWFHDRFPAYALQADLLYVYDYNFNNANYNIKGLWIVKDSGWEPEHKFESRYARIGGTAKFKEGQASIFRDRCN